MPVVFAAATSHAPGIMAWTEAAPEAQRATVFGAFDEMRRACAAARLDSLIVLTSEHWANFFLDHIGAFCVGRAEQYRGPVEPFLRIETVEIPGDVELATTLIAAAYDNGVEPSFAHELQFDHGTMIPLHLILPEHTVPVVPVIFNTLAAPQPSADRCFAFGRIIGDVARQSHRRIGILATGGLSHDPGERNHGVIDPTFDHVFLDRMARGDGAALRRYARHEFADAGAGAFELLAWIALQGALHGAPGHVLAYEEVVPWATGIGMMLFDVYHPPGRVVDEHQETHR